MSDYKITCLFDNTPSTPYPWRLEVQSKGSTDPLIMISDPARTLPEALRQLADALERGGFEGCMPISADPADPADPCAQCSELDAVDEAARYNFDYRGPTRWWHCGACGAHLERYRGGGDMACNCGAEYNAFGQRLADNWRSNASLYDDEIGDLEGYELGALSSENYS